jgi:hypothetical protein
MAQARALGPGFQFRRPGAADGVLPFDQFLFVHHCFLSRILPAGVFSRLPVDIQALHRAQGELLQMSIQTEPLNDQ